MNAAICVDTPLGPVTLQEKAGVLTSLTWASTHGETGETPLLRDQFDKILLIHQLLILLI